MKIYKAKYSGFCFGVRRAIKIAQETVSLHPDTYIKGDLVHNEKVCAQIEKKGIKKAVSLEEIPDGAVLIIKAHGEPLKTYEEAKARNLNIVDATCPMVKDIHKKALNLEKQGYQIIIIGDKKHEETIGILGNIQKGIVLENKKDIVKLKGALKKKIGVICQSTQNIEKVSRIISQLVKYAEEILFINTICQTTRMRQKETENLASQCQALLIVGSKKSANTKRLYCLAKKINKNTFWLNGSQNIEKAKFMKFNSLGIIGGASTPRDVLDKIYGELR